jgi:hypothetical protein
MPDHVLFRKRMVARNIKHVQKFEAKARAREARANKSFHPFGIGSPEYNREHKVDPKTGMPRA